MHYYVRLLGTRVVHVGSAMIWFGGAIIGGFYLPLILLAGLTMKVGRYL